MKNYQKYIEAKDTLSNKFGLNTLLEIGRRNLLDNQYYEKMLRSICESKNSFMTADYQKEILKTARNMAKLNDKDLCDYIYDKVKEERKIERGR